jgi:dTDP-glucose pyrophosphorylase
VTRLGPIVVRAGTTLREAVERMTRSGRQIALVTDEGGRLAGVVTDGDVRRALLRGLALDGPVDEAMNKKPVVVAPEVTRETALALMRSRVLRHLPVVAPDGTLVDLLTLAELQAPAAPLPTRAVIMAGGEGKRLRPLTDETPKPLLPVGGRPILEILIERLRHSGIGDIVLAVRHKSQMIRDRLGDGTRLGVQIEYVEEPRPLGTMGGLRLLRERPSAPFFVVNSDILTKCDFRAMWEFHGRQEGCALTVGVSLHQVDIPYGEFTLRGARVLNVEEKPRKEFPINAGIYVLSPSAVDAIPHDQCFDATDLIRELLASGRQVAGYVIREYWLDVGRHPDLERANDDVARGVFE